MKGFYAMPYTLAEDELARLFPDIFLLNIFVRQGILDHNAGGYYRYLISIMLVVVYCDTVC